MSGGAWPDNECGPAPAQVSSFEERIMDTVMSTPSLETQIVMLNAERSRLAAENDDLRGIIRAIRGSAEINPHSELGQRMWAVK